MISGLFVSCCCIILITLMFLFIYFMNRKYPYGFKIASGKLVAIEAEQ